MVLTDRLNRQLLEALKHTRKIEVTDTMNETFNPIGWDEAGLYYLIKDRSVAYRAFTPWSAVTRITFPEGIEP